ncbi:quinolinate synthetase A protein, partial [Streptomyces coelicoflavus ZG0656]
MFAGLVDHGGDVRLIKQRYPGLPVITYVNTTAEVKA